MFALRYFSRRFFAPRYWPELGVSEVVPASAHSIFRSDQSAAGAGIFRSDQPAAGAKVFR